MQLKTHITKNCYSIYQSAYRANQFTETFFLHVIDDVYQSCNNKSTSVLTSLDLSAAFDTINREILIERLLCL